MFDAIPHSNSRSRRPILNEFCAISFHVPFLLVNHPQISAFRKIGPDLSSTTGFGKLGSLFRQFATAGGLTPANSANSNSPIKSVGFIVNALHTQCEVSSQSCQDQSHGQFAPFARNDSI